MRKLLALTMLVSVLVVSSGCGTVAKRALKEVKGAGSKAVSVPGTSTSQFSRFSGVKISQPRTDLGGLVDRKFSSALTVALKTSLVSGKDPVFHGGSPALEIEPEITWYNEAGGLGGLLGSDSYAVVLFWLSSEGAPVGKVQVVTKSGASRTSEGDMAKSMAGELAKFFKKGRPKRK